jgi:hypothetical protein
MTDEIIQIQILGLKLLFVRNLKELGLFQVFYISKIKYL